MQSADLVVVGAGVLGCALVHAAAEEGLSVVWLERNWPQQGASVQNFGMIMPDLLAGSPNEGRLLRASLNYYHHWAELYPHLVRSCGSLVLAQTELEARVLREYADLGASRKASYMGPDTLTKTYGKHLAPGLQGGLFLSDHLGLAPQVLLPAMVDQLAALPRVAFRPNELAVEARTELGGVKLKTSRGVAIRGDRLVVCSGSEVQALFPQVLAESGLERVKLQMLAVRPQAGEHVPDLPFHILGGWSLRRYPAFQQCASYQDLAREPLPPLAQSHGLHTLLTQPMPKGEWILGDSHQFYPLQGAPVDAHWREQQVDEVLLEQAHALTGQGPFRVVRSWQGWYLRHPRQPWWLQHIDERTTVITGLAGRGMTLAPGLAQQVLAELLEAPYGG